MDIFAILFSSGPKGVCAGISLIIMLIGFSIGFLSRVIYFICKIAGAEYSNKQFLIGGLIMVIGLVLFIIFSV